MFYTYAHYTPKGEIFYIGKGTEDRAFSKKDRSYKWKEVVKKARGITIEILADWNTEEEAYSHEELLIDCFTSMGAKLVNQTIGGKSVKGYMQSPEQRAKVTEKLTGYVHKKITCPHCNTIGGATTMKRWHFDKCTGGKKIKARATIDGQRVYLGMFLTQKEADIAIKNAQLGIKI
jgi:hypothetical protein